MRFHNEAQSKTVTLTKIYIAILTIFKFTCASLNAQTLHIS